MSKKLNFRTLQLAAVAGAMIAAGSAFGAVTLPGGDTYLNGQFDEINYGATGLAYVTPFLYVGDFASTEPPTSQAAVSNLSYSYNISGMGTSLVTIDYYITNEDPASFNDLRFMVDVQPDGSASYNDIANATWGAKAANDPDHYQIEEFAFSGGLQDNITTNNGLNDSDACGGLSCDVDFALQWDLASLEPGLTWIVSVGLSDNGKTLSTRYLTATSVDTANTELTFSGQASVVPIPAAVWLFGSALIALSAVSRRSKNAVAVTA